MSSGDLAISWRMRRLLREPRMPIGYRGRRAWHSSTQRPLRDVYSVSDANAFSLAEFANHENLLRVHYRLQQVGGPGAGMDGRTYDDFGRAEAPRVYKAVEEAIRSRVWLPHRTRAVASPKSSGGFRRLDLETVVERTVSEALYLALKPFWSQTIRTVAPDQPGVGISLNRSVLLAKLAWAVEHGYTVIVTDDIRNCFPSTRIADALADHRRYINNPDLLWLVEVVLRGHDGLEKTIGINQGCPYSPMTMFVRLLHVLDLPSLASRDDSLQLRYVDNLVWACRSVTKGWSCLRRAQELLESAGFQLKGEEGPPVNLRRQGAKWRILGLLAGMEEGRLRFHVDGKAFRTLEESLAGAHETQDPTDIARKAILGWIEAAGPALEGVDEGVVVEGVKERAARYGFRELGTDEDLHERILAARGHWLRIRDAVFSQQQTP